jgi:hypothetical protein
MASTGHDESGGEVEEVDGKKFKAFYGMSSRDAMEKHYGGKRITRGSMIASEENNPLTTFDRSLVVLLSYALEWLLGVLVSGVAKYRAAEGKAVRVEYKGLSPAFCTFFCLFGC